MEEVAMNHAWRLWGTIAVMLAMWSISGCRTGLLSHTGTLVPPDRQVALDAVGEQPLRWQGNDLTLDFRARRDGNRLHLEGQVRLAQHLTNFDTLESLDIQVHFLDVEGRVLTSHGVYAAGYRTPQFLTRWTFGRDLQFPEGAGSISFSYKGRVITGGGARSHDDGGDQTSWDFWQMP
jgi:hypothetical protein